MAMHAQIYSMRPLHFSECVTLVQRVASVSKFNKWVMLVPFELWLFWNDGINDLHQKIFSFFLLDDGNITQCLFVLA